MYEVIEKYYKKKIPPRITVLIWSRCPESNRRPFPYHGNALPSELQRLTSFMQVNRIVTKNINSY